MKIQLFIMCKAPVAGEVKTRLLSRYSTEEAARLYAGMAETVIHRASRLFDHVCIAADDPTHPFFSTFDLPVCSQGGGDLGERMSRLMHQGFADGADAVIFLGADSPHMADSRLLQAAEALQNHDVVIGPVEDGGYDLIAMTSPQNIFDEIQWSSGHVSKQTLAHVRRLSLSCLQLDIGFDIDYPEDIERAVRAGWQPGESDHPTLQKINHDTSCNARSRIPPRQSSTESSSPPPSDKSK
jgi:rSAM/selenodomain-associated transferase 1